MKKALLIIDVQNGYFSNGKCQLYKPEVALNTIKDLLKNFRKQDLPVIYIRHESIQGTFFIPNTDGVQIHNDIKPLDTETVIVKHYPNSFYETNLQNKLVENGANIPADTVQSIFMASLNQKFANVITSTEFFMNKKYSS